MNCSYYINAIRRASEDFDEIDFQHLNKRDNSNLSNLSEISKDDEIWEVPEESFENVYQQMEVFHEDLIEAKNDLEESHEINSSRPSEIIVEQFQNPKKIHLNLSTKTIALKSQQQQHQYEISDIPETMTQQPIINKSINTETDITKSLTNDTTTTTTTTTTIGNKVQWKNVKINNNNNTNAKNKQNNDKELVRIPEIKLSSSSSSSTKKIPALKTIKHSGEFQPSANSGNRPRRKSSSGSETKKNITDCSTSPESLLDNILSAASSVSVQSSSLSSSGLLGEMENRNNPLKINETPCSLSTPMTVAMAKSNSDIFISQIPEVNIITAPNSPLNEQPINTGKHISPSLLTISNLSHSDSFETASNRSRSPSSSPLRNLCTRVFTPQVPLYPDELNCQICCELLKEPRSLNCLHSFCFQCIVNENFKQDASTPFWSQPKPNPSPKQQLDDQDGGKAINAPASPETPSVRSTSDAVNSPIQQKRRSSFSFKRKKSSDHKNKSDNSCGSLQKTNNTQRQPEEAKRLITCKICQFQTEVPVGGIRQLPQNLMIVRRIEEIRFKVGEEVITRIWCSLCFEETTATYHCLTCILNLCTLCKESHERQKNTTQHNIKNIIELRRARKEQNIQFIDNSKFNLKCSMHPGFEIKSFCTICLQIACTDCLILLHKGHKHEPISKSIKFYSQILRESLELTKPRCNYAEHSIGKLNEIAKSINRKCDEIQAEVEEYMGCYFEAVTVHKTTLLQQVHRARETKVEMILEQQLDLENRIKEAMSVVKFSQELIDVASDVEILSFFKVVLQRFEYCQQFKAPVDPKVSDTLHFLSKIRAPAAKNLNNIPIYGIITMQIVEPFLCTLQWDGLTELRLHKKAEILLISRDADGVTMCHGGLEIQTQLNYKDNISRLLPIEVSDNRDGSYIIAFVPDSQGTLILSIHINNNPIKGSPFTLQARAVRPHSGIYHCCAFCSSKGNRLMKCSCDGRMPGYNGCGHGHAGHPGRRHWSCCGSVLENSECNESNKLLNSK